jgi:hypothetical protein
VSRGLDPSSRLGCTTGRASVRPAESRARLDRGVGGRGSALGLVVTAGNGHVGNDSLVNSLGCSTSARSLSSNGGSRKSGLGREDQSRPSRRRGGRRQDQSRGRVDCFAAGCDSLVARCEVCHSQPSAEEGGLAVRHHSR